VLARSLIARLAWATSLAALFAAALAAAALAAGPPFPDPVLDQAVYDQAGALREETRRQVEAAIDAIEQRTGAEVVVYTQLVPGWTSDADAENHAIALMDQWGIGRRGFDDGLVILYDLYEEDPCHGRVQLYAGPGYRATFLDNGERQAIFDNDMLPRLRGCDLDGALLAAMAKIDANATPQHADRLTFFRQLNAVIGVGGLFVAALVVAFGVTSWRRFGRDPVYLDDASIHIPAPPPGLTPAAGAVVRDGRSTRRALTAASLDLAARGYISFDADETGLLRKKTELSIRTTEAATDDPVEEARLRRARGRPMDGATRMLRVRLQALGGLGGIVDPTQLLQLGSHVGAFDTQIEEHVHASGWFTAPPGKVTRRWIGYGVVTGLAGGGAIFLGFNLPSDGLVLAGGGMIAAGVILALLAPTMPARTMPGAMIRAMLEAYRRTLEKSMAQARTMGEVVAASAVPLIESPDDAVVWGVALGLGDEVEGVLSRTMEDAREGRANGYLPLWYSSGGGGGWSGGGGGGGWAPGLMSGSAIPNLGGMMAALGTIGDSPSSSGSGGGGGFGGGGSGGGGGGAGGGF
jgi:uncharacterized membrane protein YgcG